MALFLEMKDDKGAVLQPPSRPITRTVFTSRPKDRISETSKPWTPEALARALRQAEEGDLSAQADLMEHMIERDGELAGYMQTRTLGPASQKWSIMPRNDTPEAKAAADLCREIIGGIPNFRGYLLKVADGIGKGIAALEIDWRDDKTISSIRWIHPKRYRYDWATETFMIVPDDPSKEWEPEPVRRDEFKIIVHKPQLRATHPSRGGVMRTVVWAFLFRNYALKDWVTFSEVFGMPLRLGKYPPGAKNEDKDELREAMMQLGSDAYAIIDNRVEIEYAEAVDRGVHPGDAIFSAMGRQYQFAILGQDQTASHNEAGGRTQVQFGGAPIQQTLLQADCEDISLTTETDLLFPICGWHFDWGTASKVTPIFKLHYEPEDDYAGLATVDETVHIKLGVPTTWGELAKRYGRQLPKDIDPETVVFFNEYVPPGFEGKPHVIITAGSITGMSSQQRDEKAQADAQAQADAAKAAGAAGRGLRSIPGGRGRQSAETEMLAAFTLLAQMQQGTGNRLASPEQTALDAATEALIPRAAAAMRQLAGPVLAAVAESSSLEELEQRLATVYPDLDEGEIEKLLRRAWYVSRLFGQAVSEFRTNGDGN